MKFKDCIYDIRGIMCRLQLWFKDSRVNEALSLDRSINEALSLDRSINDLIARWLDAKK
jgi:hypothetical protein